MNSMAICAALLSAAVACAPTTGAAATSSPFGPPQQTTGAGLQETQADPLIQVTKGFPGSIKLNEKRRLLEFCPDRDACDGFVALSTVPVVTLKDFAYLYIYFFSGYYDLPKWRTRDQARNAAESVLARPNYSMCRRDSSIESARCVLLDLNRGGRIKLLFVRYDEGKRSVVHEDIVKELSGGGTAPKQQKQ